MTHPVWVPLAAVVAIHDHQIARHGGMPGLRDKALLEMGCARALNLVAYADADLSEIAAAYAFGIAKAHAFVDSRFEVRSKGRSLPYKIFDMDQRVTHAAITDNKRLSAVLEHIKEMQDAAPPKPKVRTNSKKMGYKPNGRRPGRPSGACAKKKIVHATE